jgi:hypothetical protein
VTSMRSSRTVNRLYFANLHVDKAKKGKDRRMDGR